ncbi:hypothetical protein CC1G_14525 [Coprinopsis cinerea okayama7|uniref:Uncharacterized protein n=1 Tax=Coprinopsis cinerea (strain Okayama-7 / 130 / ATCC MYA-4618 / FGSC 9003) TaxID=240176 RepID=D6RM62_COPC7|nr:hypothetical protein CC1G_14525 [Coprinopsis cinerea okayama7\|eukprot:XP_002911523.1 hypothetical protein CC1G_14525 [Coprinopsis cinerea okayama7\
MPSANKCWKAWNHHGGVNKHNEAKEIVPQMHENKEPYCPLLHVFDQAMEERINEGERILPFFSGQLLGPN